MEKETIIGNVCRAVWLSADKIAARFSQWDEQSMDDLSPTRKGGARACSFIMLFVFTLVMASLSAYIGLKAVLEVMEVTGTMAVALGFAYTTLVLWRIMRRIREREIAEEEAEERAKWAAKFAAEEARQTTDESTP